MKQSSAYRQAVKTLDRIIAKSLAQFPPEEQRRRLKAMDAHLAAARAKQRAKRK